MTLRTLVTTSSLQNAGDGSGEWLMINSYRQPIKKRQGQEGRGAPGRGRTAGGAEPRPWLSAAGPAGQRSSAGQQPVGAA